MYHMVTRAHLHDDVHHSSCCVDATTATVVLARHPHDDDTDVRLDLHDDRWACCDDRQATTLMTTDGTPKMQETKLRDLVKQRTVYETIISALGHQHRYVYADRVGAASDESL